jgi:hypothetical protein
VAKGNVRPFFGAPGRHSGHGGAAARGSSATGLTLKLGGLIALAPLSVTRGAVAFSIRRTHVLRAVRSRAGSCQSYCYRELCLILVNDESASSMANAPTLRWRVFWWCRGRPHLAIGLQRELVSRVNGTAGCDFCSVNFVMGETARRELTAPAQGGSTLEHRGAAIDIIRVEHGQLTYRVASAFRS